MNKEIDKTILKVLEKIEDNGFEAYIVGGFVRDYLLGIVSTDIDICTNALPKDLVNIFDNYNISNSDYGSFKMITSRFNFDITTYRKELAYSGRRPSEIEYVDSLIEDINRRDFTINTLCMNSKGEIIDLLNAKDDLDSKLVKCVGEVQKKFREDPLRMLRAIRFATTLDFKLDEEIIIGITNNKNLISTLSNTRRKEELDKILTSSNALYGLDLIKKLDLLSELNISFDSVIYVEDICGMYSQMMFDDSMPFTKTEKNNINSIRDIISYGTIDNYILFNYGLYLSIVAGKIMGIDVININERYNSLVIKSDKDIDISTLDICNTLNIPYSSLLKSIKNDIRSAILDGSLENNKADIIKYILSRKWFDEGDCNKST